MLLNVQIVGLIHFVLRNIEVRHGDRRAAVVQHPGAYPKPIPPAEKDHQQSQRRGLGWREISMAHLEICLT